MSMASQQHGRRWQLAACFQCNSRPYDISICNTHTCIIVYCTPSITVKNCTFSTSDHVHCTRSTSKEPQLLRVSCAFADFRIATPDYRLSADRRRLTPLSPMNARLDSWKSRRECFRFSRNVENPADEYMRMNICKPT